MKFLLVLPLMFQIVQTMASYSSCSPSEISLAGQPTSNVSGRSDNNEREGGGQIRVGREYQAFLPVYTAHGERKAQDCAERALLVWSPSQEEDVKLDKFIHIAIDK